MPLSTHEKKCLDEIISKFEGKEMAVFSIEECARFSPILNVLETEGYVRRHQMDGGCIYILDANLDDFVAKIKSDEKDERREQRSEIRKEALVALISAIIGGLVTLLFEHFGEIIDFVKGLF